MLLLFVRAYSLGGGTYTGIEAVSNGLPIMREPRVQTGKRTMVYMAIVARLHRRRASCSATCCWHVAPDERQDDERGAGRAPDRGTSAAADRSMVVVVTHARREGALLFVAAQTGFIDGPRVMANMAVDSWLPHRFAALSDRLTTQNGVLLMGARRRWPRCSTPSGDVDTLVVMYSINVFLTFSLSMFGMLRHPGRRRREAQQLAPQASCCSPSASCSARRSWSSP